MLHISVGFVHPNRWSQKPTCGQNLWYWSRPLSGTRQFLCRPSPVNDHDTSFDSGVLVYALDTISGSNFCLIAPPLPLLPWRQFQNREKQSHVSVCSDHPPQRSPLRWQFFDWKIFSTSSQEKWNPFDKVNAIRVSVILVFEIKCFTREETPSQSCRTCWRLCEGLHQWSCSWVRRSRYSWLALGSPCLPSSWIDCQKHVFMAIFFFTWDGLGKDLLLLSIGLLDLLDPDLWDEE